MAKNLSEDRILDGLDGYGAHADELTSTGLSPIFAYRAFDLRDRFPSPFPDFRDALEALQSGVAYLPEISGEIVAYCRDGRSIEIPRHFFIRNKRRFGSRVAAEQWVRGQMEAMEGGDTFAEGNRSPPTKPDDPFESQVEEALAWQHTRLIEPENNDQVCEQVNRWLLGQLESGS